MKGMTFSLRRLFLVVAAIALCCALVGREVASRHRERKATDVILQSGGAIRYECSAFDVPYCPTRCEETYARKVLRGSLSNEMFGRVRTAVCGSTTTETTVGALQDFDSLTIVSFLDAHIDSIIIRRLASVTQCRHVKLLRCELSEGALSDTECLMHLEGLEIVNGDGRRVDIKQLAVLANLRLLRIENSDVELRDLRLFAKPERMKVISLNYCTCLGTLSELAPFCNLSHLHLVNTNMGDDDVAVIAGFEGLEFVDLRGTQVSDRGLLRLRHLLPTCTVVGGSGGAQRRVR